MFINLRYHIASLVAVFLALGLGILIGFAAPWDQSLAESQQQLASRLESQIELQRKKNDSLKASINTLEMQNSIQSRFEKQVLPLLVKGRLKDKSIAIIDINGSSPPADLIETLKSSGAAIQSVTLLGGLALDVKKEPEIMTTATTDREVNKYSPGCEIARSILTGEAIACGVLDEKSLKSTGQYGTRVTDVVLVGSGRQGSNRNLSSLDSDIINYFQSRNIRVIGVEESMAQFSCMERYQEKKLTTVDNIDTVPGLVSLVYAIEGRPGSYGIKSSAKRMLPDLESEVSLDVR